MGKKAKQHQRPMTGFSKITFGDDGPVQVACSTCGQTKCFCIKDLEGNVHALDMYRSSASSSLPSTASASTTTTTTTAKKFNWKRAIRAKLESAGGIMKKKQLRKLVIAEAGNDDGNGDHDIRKAFRKALKKMSGVAVEGKRVKMLEVAKEDTSNSGGGGPSVVGLHTDEDWMMMMQASMQTVVIVDFGAVWCQACQEIAPCFASLCKEHPTLLFVKVDVDEMSEAADECKVKELPTFQIFRRGERVDSISPGNSKPKLGAFVQRALRYAEA